MNIDKFWQIIETGKDSDEPEIIVCEALRKLSANEIASYQEHFDQLYYDADRWSLWGAAYMIGGGCSDDGFIDFRYGLIAKGREVYEKAIKNPDSLAELGAGVEIRNETFGYLAQEIYEELTGDEVPRSEITVSDTLGEQWDFDDDSENKKYLPKLMALFEEEIEDESEDSDYPEPSYFIYSEEYGYTNSIKFRFGWNKESTKVLVESDINNISFLQGHFKIPNLGEKAKEIETLNIQYHESLCGVDQFINIKSLQISDTAKNPLEFSKLKHLAQLSLDWNKTYQHELSRCNNLVKLTISGYKYKGLTELKCIKKLKSLSLHKGNVESFDGINPTLERLGLSYTSKFYDLKSIQKLKNLSHLNINNAKKLKGVLKISQFIKLATIDNVVSSCILDLDGIDRLVNLSFLWCNNDCLNANWEKIIALPKIRMIGLYAEGITKEEIYEFAKANNKEIISFTKAGTKKKPFLKIDIKS